jgi:hypothetical protein
MWFKLIMLCKICFLWDFFLVSQMFLFTVNGSTFVLDVVEREPLLVVLMRLFKMRFFVVFCNYLVLFPQLVIYSRVVGSAWSLSYVKRLGFRAVELNVDSIDLPECGCLFWDFDQCWLKDCIRKIRTILKTTVIPWCLFGMVSRRCNIRRATPILIRWVHGLVNLYWQVQITHTRLEGNKSTYFVANLNIMLSSVDTHILKTPPINLRSLLFNDIFNTYMPMCICLGL